GCQDGSTHVRCRSTCRHGRLHRKHCIGTDRRYQCGADRQRRRFDGASRTDGNRRAVPLCLYPAKTLRTHEHQFRASAGNTDNRTKVESRKTAHAVRTCPGVMQTSNRININGVITAPEDAKVSVLDHGFLFGDSVYEALRTYGGKPFLFSRHFSRLEHSADAVHLKLPWSKSKTLEEIRKTCLPGECRIRVIVTRGIGDLSPALETCA